MPDVDGKLTPEERAKVEAWLEKQDWFREGKCPICGDDHWAVGDHIVQPIRFGPMAFGGPSYPQVMLISNKCGYTLYFNAVIMGLLPAAASAEAPAPAPQKPAA